MPTTKTVTTLTPTDKLKGARIKFMPRNAKMPSAEFISSLNTSLSGFAKIIAIIAITHIISIIVKAASFILLTPFVRRSKAADFHNKKIMAYFTLALIFNSFAFSIKYLCLFLSAKSS
jgi:predicted small integral membrane protein